MSPYYSHGQKPTGTCKPNRRCPPTEPLSCSLQVETKVARGRYEGRVEYVISGQATHFASLEELLMFIGRVLATVRVRHAGKCEAEAEKTMPTTVVQSQ